MESPIRTCLRGLRKSGALGDAREENRQVIPVRPMPVYHPRPMKVDVRNSDDVIVVDLTGRLVAGDGADVLHEVVNTLLADDWTKIVLNMSDVSMIDSTGAGELIESLKIAEKFKSRIKLLRPQERVQKSLQLSQLLPLFEVFDDEDEVIRSFNA